MATAKNDKSPEDTPTPDDAPTSDLAEEMKSGGAMPADVDVAAMFAQIQAMQARIDSLTAAAGIPSDPVEAALKDVRNHVKARADAHPERAADFRDLLDTLAGVDNPDRAVTSQDTDLIRTLATELHAHPYEGSDYVCDLANALHKLALKVGGAGK